MTEFPARHMLAAMQGSLTRRRFGLLAAGLLATARTAAAEDRPRLTNDFFAMDTAARGKPQTVVPLLKALGYAGLGGQPGDTTMPASLRAQGLRFFNAYHVASFDSQKPALDDFRKRAIDALEEYDSAIWLAIARVTRDGQPLAGGDAADELVAKRLAELADYAQPRGVRLALYPHAGMWLDRVEHATKLAEQVNRPSVGATFNLCHWLRVEGSERDPAPVLAAAGARLMFLTINGADTGDTRKMNWDRLIQPLGEGSYDIGAFLDRMLASGYRGPIGLQGFGIKMEPIELLTRSMAAWKKYQASRS